jgi:hypothetical protein
MKNAINFYGIIVFIFAVLVVIGCRAKQAPLQNTTVKAIEKETITHETSNTFVNKEILDEMVFKLSKINSVKPDCDSLINFYREEFAISLEMWKKSGDNQYLIQYDKLLKQLKLQIKIAETINKEFAKNTQTTTTTDEAKIVEVAVKLPLSWWENLFYRLGQIGTAAAALMIGFFLIKHKFSK